MIRYCTAYEQCNISGKLKLYVLDIPIMTSKYLPNFMEAILLFTYNHIACIF